MKEINIDKEMPRQRFTASN
jgi:hypothetical protein